MFRRRFWWSLLLTIPLIITSHMIMDWFNYDLDFPGIEWVGPVLGTVVFFWAGWPFLAGGWQELKSRRPGMMLLITLAISVAYVASLASSLDLFDMDFWWELAALISIMLLGHWQEMKALGQAQSALAALAELLPDEAERVAESGAINTVSLSELRTGDVVLVRSGGRVPADGEIIDGEAELDESMVTGESRPVAKRTGDRVVAGTVSTDSSIRVRLTAVGEETTLAGIQRLVAVAQSSHSRAQALADRFAALLFYVAAGAGVLTFIVWALLGDMDAAVTNTVTVLVIACPHALGLAIPLVISISSAMAARSGILVKDRLSLERMRTVNTILFDKTGTLTKGSHAVAGVVGAGRSEDEVLRLAGGIEADSEHPLAKAIVAAAKDRGDVATATDFRSLTGRGVEATIDNRRYGVGGPAMLRERHLTEPETIRSTVQDWKQRGASVLYVVEDETIIGALSLEDEIRPEAQAAIAELHQMDRRVVMITGDARQVAETVGQQLGIDEVMAEVLPEDKDAKVAELQGRGLTVAMVGDGVNDAPALARADVGLAIGAGTDVAIESAGVVLASSDPRSVVSVIALSKASYRKMIQNLAWAGGYNLAAIPLAAGVLAWAGITLPPAVGAVLMSLSTIVVALNAQLLRRVDLWPETAAAETTSHQHGFTSKGVVVALAAALGIVAIVAGVIALKPDNESETTVQSDPGLSAESGGYTFVPETGELPSGQSVTYRFRITGPDAQAVTNYEVEHEKELHLIVASKDLTSYHHVHPERSADGVWAVTLPALESGPHRAFADFVVADGPDLTLGVDLTVSGTYQARALPAVSQTQTVDDYTVTLSGNAIAGRESEMVLSVSRSGNAVTDLQPYLGALGHLVALRTTDLAYLHVHPLQEGHGPGGPEVKFMVNIPTEGTYRVFFDFSHGDTVRTAAFTVEATERPSAPPSNSGEHGGH
jgi:Cu2+-exporting ATPase